jgi:1-acyl-sn-glycerol-3-phosphate acyltransferase
MTAILYGEELILPGDIAEAIRDAGRAAHVGTANLARRCLYSMRRLWWHSYWRMGVQGVRNVPMRGPMLLCANHTSHLDAIAILAALPTATALRTSTAAAQDVFGDHRLRNSVSRLTTNAISIRRGTKFAAGLRTLEGVLRDRRPLILFPEGRRSPDGKLLKFKCGAAMLAIRTGAPIVPVRLEGLHESLARGKHLPLPTNVTVRFGEPIDPRPYRDDIASGRSTKRQAYEELTHEVKAAIAQVGRALPAA